MPRIARKEAAAGIALALVLLTAASARGEQRRYSIDAGRSRTTILVGKSGLFRFAGHEHEVVAPAVTGQVSVDLADLSRSSVVISFAAAALRVTGRGEPPEDVPKVQTAMIGPKVLDAARFSLITFRSDSISAEAPSGGMRNLEVRGVLSLHGMIRRLTLPLRLQIAGDSLVATGATTFRQSDFAIHPISIAGAVKVKDELAVTYQIVARSR